MNDTIDRRIVNETPIADYGTLLFVIKITN
jgi:hypothetical protein